MDNKKFINLDDVLNESHYSSNGGMTDDADINSFINFTCEYHDLPNSNVREDIENVLMLYKDLLNKIRNAMDKMQYESALHWYNNVESFLKIGEYDKSNYSYQKSYEIALEAIKGKNRYLVNESTERDVTGIVENLIATYGINTTANILRNEINEDTDLNTEIKTNEDNEVSDVQVQNNQQYKLSDETTNEYDKLYNGFQEFLSKYANDSLAGKGISIIKNVLDEFKRNLPKWIESSKSQQQNNQPQNNQQQNNQQQNNQQQNNQQQNNQQQNNQ